MNRIELGKVRASAFKIAAIFTILIGMLAPITSVGAKGKTPVSFTFYEIPNVIGTKTVDGNTILELTFTGDTFHGAFEGTGSGYGWAVVHKDNNFNVLHIETFTGLMGSKSGTIVFMFVGQGMFVGNLPVKGTWFILRGTGGLAIIHGEGTFERLANTDPTDLTVTLTGSVYFAP